MADPPPGRDPRASQSESGRAEAPNGLRAEDFRPEREAVEAKRCFPLAAGLGRTASGRGHAAPPVRPLPGGRSTPTQFCWLRLRNARRWAARGAESFSRLLRGRRGNKSSEHRAGSSHGVLSQRSPAWLQHTQVFPKHVGSDVPECHQGWGKGSQNHRIINVGKDH